MTRRDFFARALTSVLGLAALSQAREIMDPRPEPLWFPLPNINPIELLQGHWQSLLQRRLDILETRAWGLLLGN